MLRALVLSLVFGASFLALVGCAALPQGGVEAPQAGETTAKNSADSGGVAGTTANRPSGGRVETCGGGAIRLNAKEKKVFELHNEVRQERGLQPFCVQPDLTKAARVHSREMIRKDYFSHSSYDGTPLVERLRRHGYTTEGYRNWRVAGNIAWGNYSQGTPEYVFNGWMNSESHRPHILSERLRQIGVGTYTGEYKNYKNSTAYTAEFGMRLR